MITAAELRKAVPESASTVDVVVPVFNEREILKQQLLPVLETVPAGFRVMVLENGSNDGTKEILQDLQSGCPILEVVSVAGPNYGLAMRTGLSRAMADIVIVDDLDVLDTDFWVRGLRILGDGDTDLVQGSKVLAGRNDRRPLSRKAATLVLTFLLKTLLGYRGTDTHGPKVVWRSAIEDIVPACKRELDMFPTELVLRIQRKGLKIVEIPIHLREIRTTPVPLLKRIPRVLRDIWRLHVSMRKDPG